MTMLMLSFNFASVKAFNAFVLIVVNALGIYSRTSRVKAEVRLENIRKRGGNAFHDRYGVLVPDPFGMRVYIAMNALVWGKRTGRFHIDAERFVDSLSGYQYSRLIVKLALSKNTGTEQAVVDYINGKLSMGLPIVEA